MHTTLPGRATGRADAQPGRLAGRDLRQRAGLGGGADRVRPPLHPERAVQVADDTGQIEVAAVGGEQHGALAAGLAQAEESHAPGL